MNPLPEITAPLLKHVFGESLDLLDLLLLVPQSKEVNVDETAGLIKQLLCESYPLCSGEPSVYTIAAVSDLDMLQTRRWHAAGLFWPSLAQGIDKAALIRLLARLRDLHANKVIHIEQNDAQTQGWTMADSLALGFSSLALPKDRKSGLQFTDLQIYDFDIHSYKPAPDWLNARHWANPEMWEKHRW